MKLGKQVRQPFPTGKNGNSDGKGCRVFGVALYLCIIKISDNDEKRTNYSERDSRRDVEARSECL